MRGSERSLSSGGEDWDLLACRLTPQTLPPASTRPRLGANRKLSGSPLSWLQARVDEGGSLVCYNERCEAGLCQATLKDDVTNRQRYSQTTCQRVMQGAPTRACSSAIAAVEVGRTITKLPRYSSSWWFVILTTSTSIQSHQVHHIKYAISSTPCQVDRHINTLLSGRLSGDRYQDPTLTPQSIKPTPGSSSAP